MRPTNVLLALAALSALPACGGAAAPVPASRAPMKDVGLTASPAFGGAPSSAEAAPGVALAEETAVAKAESAKVTVASDGDDGGSASGSSSGAPSAPAPAPIASPSNVELLDIEARLSIEVEKVADAAAKVREVARRNGGQVIVDRVDDSAGSAAGSFMLRVPSRGSEKFLEELAGVGIVRNRQVTARDIGKEFHDAQILLHNLQTTLHRYEEILGKAQDVNQILAIEREMTRIRGEIDQVKGNLRWLKDRASRATVYVTLFTAQPDVTPTFDPKATLYPGVRMVHLADFRGENGSYGFAGFGLSIAAGRSFSLDIDGLRDVGSPGRGLDALLVTIGGELYSDFLGGGRRKVFNPYLGWRLGYARIATGDGPKGEVLVGGTLGFELYKTKFVRLDAQTRLLGLFGNKDVGGHLGVQSGLQVHIAF